KPSLVRECEIFAIPGGFTYGDDLGAGCILAQEVAHFLGGELAALRAGGGTLLGICNGFQTLLKAGLLPGVEGMQATLTWNLSHRFECRWTRLRVESGLAPLLPEGALLPAPAAHAEGRLVFGASGDARALLEQGLVAFRYADAEGKPTPRYPDCPNGSEEGIAGLVSRDRRVVGLMPHPERNLSAESLPDRGRGAWGRGGEGLLFFRALLDPYRASVAS
ncbi:MAG: phosphoribosylformylglycinamidine synthase subunit PurQ, partial [Planctomycetota bacterium]